MNIVLMIIGGLITLLAFLGAISNMAKGIKGNSKNMFDNHLKAMGAIAIGSFTFLAGLIWTIIDLVQGAM